MTPLAGLLWHVFCWCENLWLLSWRLGSSFQKIGVFQLFPYKRCFPIFVDRSCVIDRYDICLVVLYEYLKYFSSNWWWSTIFFTTSYFFSARNSTLTRHLTVTSTTKRYARSFPAIATWKKTLGMRKNDENGVDWSFFLFFITWKILKDLFWCDNKKSLDFFANWNSMCQKGWFGVYVHHRFGAGRWRVGGSNVVELPVTWIGLLQLNSDITVLSWKLMHWKNHCFSFNRKSSTAQMFHVCLPDSNAQSLRSLGWLLGHFTLETTDWKRPNTWVFPTSIFPLTITWNHTYGWL